MAALRWRALGARVVVCAAVAFLCTCSRVCGAEGFGPQPQPHRPEPLPEYLARRGALVAAEVAMGAGAGASLTPTEQAADGVLAAAKAAELAVSPPLPSVHFFQVRL